MITFLSDAGFAPIANHVETSRTRTTIGATRRQTPGKAFWSLRGLEFGHFKNYLVRPRGKADALLPSAGRSGVSKASRLTLLPETFLKCSPSGRMTGANRSWSPKVGQMSRVLQGQTTGRFEVEDFAKHIQMPGFIHDPEKRRFPW